MCAGWVILCWISKRVFCWVFMVVLSVGFPRGVLLVSKVVLVSWVPIGCSMLGFYGNFV